MNRKVSVLLVISLLIFSLDLPAKERRGADLVVTKNDGQVLKGELIAVKQNSVLLLSPEGADVSVDIKDIDIIKIVKKSKVLKWSGIGLLGGALTGALVGSLGPAEWYSWFSRSETVLIAAGVGGAVGLLIGTLIGVSASYDEKIMVVGKSDAETKEIMEKLRRQARVPNAQ